MADCLFVLGGIIPGDLLDFFVREKKCF